MDPVNEDELLPDQVRDVIPLLGPYALGSLGAEDRVKVEEALASSELARMLYRDVAEAAVALGVADPAHIDDRDEPPPELEHRILAAARRRRSTPFTAVAAAAASVVVLAVAGVITFGSRTEPPPVPRETFTFEAAEPIEVLQADLIAHTWGTEVEFVVSGVEDGETYTVAFLDQGGDRVDAGSFIGVADKPVDCRMNAALLRDDATGLVVRDASGTIVLEAELA